MHFFRDEKGRVYVQTYSSEMGRNIKWPRESTHHLDDLTDEQIEKALQLIKPSEPIADQTILLHLESWCNYLEAQGSDYRTVRMHRSFALRFILPFFVNHCGCPSPKKWPEFAGRFYTYMTTVGQKLEVGGRTVPSPATPHQHRLANGTLRLFYEWLAHEGHAPSVELKLRLPKIPPAETQLKRLITPEEVVAWAQECESKELKLLALVGFFFSLRPQELFGLTYADFAVGEEVTELECSKAMKDAGLFDRFVVNVDKQKQPNGKVKVGAKTDSNGWVACFNQVAAALILELIADLGDEEALFKHNNRKLFQDWKDGGIPEMSLKDLRRASLYWLGHKSEMKTLQLQKHARHKNLKTTEIYCKRPEETLKRKRIRLDMKDLF